MGNRKQTTKTIATGKRAWVLMRLCLLLISSSVICPILGYAQRTDADVSKAAGNRELITTSHSDTSSTSDATTVERMKSNGLCSSVFVDRNAACYHGGSLSEKINSAIRDSSAGQTIIADTSGYSGVNLPTSVLLNKGVTLRFTGSQPLVLGDNATIDLMASWAKVDLGRREVLAGHAGGIRIGDDTHPVYKWCIVDGYLHPGPAKKPLFGVRFQKAHEGNMSNVHLTEFNSAGAAGILFAGEVWTNVFDNVMSTRNTYGILSTGGGVNAINFRTAVISGNIVGYLHDEGDRSSNNITFANDSHFEDNTTAGVWIKSGELWELELTNSYAELHNGAPLVLIQGDGRFRCIVHKFTYTAGHLWTSGGIPFRVDASQNKLDLANATIIAASVGNSGGTHEIAEAVGPNAHIVLLDSTLTLSAGNALPRGKMTNRGSVVLIGQN